MDTLTHALSGALLAHATAPRAGGSGELSPRARVAAGFLSCAFPDLDIVAALGGTVEYLSLHRGVTHSVLLAPLWAWLLAWLASKLARDARGWKPWFAACLLGLYAHIAGDVITSFGTMVFAPLSDWRAALGTTFIIDPWFTGIIVAGLAVSYFLPHSRVPAVAASVVLAGYIGMQAVLKHQAEQFGKRYAAAAHLRGAQVEAQPRPVSPFNWTVFVSDASAHHFAHINLVRTEVRPAHADDGLIAQLDRAYRPLADAHWESRARFGVDPAVAKLARDAWASPALAFFRWFADKPAFDGVTSGSTCVWFVDLRFDSPGRGSTPFRFGACRDAPSAPWRPYRRIGEAGRAPLD
ncbi:MAG TPA: metal-dependent hydrolase [Burkholderiales bacterium]|nr:metal-dependent hydrolase [Burkholderiales bacterium]